jgi:hypothetical protein
MFEQHVGERKLNPRFPEFYNDKNYMKLVGTEYGKFNDPRPFEPVKAKFNNEKLTEMMDTWKKTKKQDLSKYLKIAEDIIQETKKFNAPIWTQFKTIPKQIAKNVGEIPGEIAKTVSKIPTHVKAMIRKQELAKKLAKNVGKGVGHMALNPDMLMNLIVPGTDPTNQFKTMQGHEFMKRPTPEELEAAKRRAFQLYGT